MLFNYSRLLKKEALIIAITMTVIIIGYSSIMRMLFPNLPEYRDDVL